MNKMENKRITLNICGINITLITNENEEYIKSLGRETAKLFSEVKASSGEVAALTVALSFLDERNKLQNKLDHLLEENRILKEKSEKLSETVKIQSEKIKEPKEIKEVSNPIRELYKTNLENLTSFYIKEENSEK